MTARALYHVRYDGVCVHERTSVQSRATRGCGIEWLHLRACVADQAIRPTGHPSSRTDERISRRFLLKFLSGRGPSHDRDSEGVCARLPWVDRMDGNGLLGS